MSFLPSLFLSPTPPTLKLIDFFFFDLLLHIYGQIYKCNLLSLFYLFVCIWFQDFPVLYRITNYGAHSWQKPEPLAQQSSVAYRSLCFCFLLL